MNYLLIPLAAFLVALICVRWIHPIKSTSKGIRGKLADLDMIAQILMTAKLGDRRLRMAVAGRVTWMDVIFDTDTARIELPLVTQSQRKHGDQLLEHLVRHDAGAIRRTEADDYGDDRTVLCAEICASQLEMADVLRSIFMKVFAVEDSRRIEYTVTAFRNDLYLVSEHLRRPDLQNPEAPVAATSSQIDPTEWAGRRSGCIIGVFGSLLLPVPVVATYYLFGAWEAAAAFIALSIAFWPIQIWYRQDQTGLTIDIGISLVTYALMAAYLSSGNLVYWQIVPTVLCGLRIVQIVVSFCTAGKWPLFPNFDAKPFADMNKFVAVSMLVLPVAAVALLNEHLRVHASVEVWIWYFAFVKMEMIMAVTLSFIPFVLWLHGRNFVLPIDPLPAGAGRLPDRRRLRRAP